MSENYALSQLCAGTALGARRSRGLREAQRGAVTCHGVKSRKDRLHMLPGVSAFAFVVSCSEI